MFKLMLHSVSQILVLTSTIIQFALNFCCLIIIVLLCTSDFSLSCFVFVSR